MSSYLQRVRAAYFGFFQRKREERVRDCPEPTWPDWRCSRCRRIHTHQDVPAACEPFVCERCEFGGVWSKDA